MTRSPNFDHDFCNVVNYLQVLENNVTKANQLYEESNQQIELSIKIQRQLAAKIDHLTDYVKQLETILRNTEAFSDTQLVTESSNMDSSL